MGNKNKLPDILTKEELIKLFESMIRPKCIIACFTALMCGLRVREVCNLQISDMNLERRIIKIRDSKNTNRKKQGNYGKDRIVPIPEVAISPIKKWLDIVEGGKWFLPSAKSPDMQLRTKTLHIWFAEARERAKLDEVDYKIKYKQKTKYREDTAIYKFRFHHFRHFYATYVYEKTRDLYAVANLLGHNQVTTTQIYAKISDKQMKETIDFAFNMPIKTQIFEKNPVNAINYAIPEIAKREKTPIEILEERFARGELSDIEYQNKIRLMRLAKDHLKQDKDDEKMEIKILNKEKSKLEESP
jgi:integrase